MACIMLGLCANASSSLSRAHSMQVPVLTVCRRASRQEQRAHRRTPPTCSLTNLMALPIGTDSGLQATRNWMAVFSCAVRSRDSTLPAGVW